MSKKYKYLLRLIELTKLEKGELEHRRVKKFYARTNKNVAVRQMTQIERRENALRRIQRKTAAVGSEKIGDSIDVSGHSNCISSNRVTQVR